jgi:hypothetical protein
MTNKVMIGAFVLATVLAGASARADVIDEFQALCLSHLDQPAGSKKAAAKRGYAPVDLGKGSFMASNRKIDTTLQVNAFTRHSYECAVTTSDVADPKALKARFFQSLGVKAKGNRVAAKVGSQTYTFEFNTTGGEALVVYRD